MYLVRYLIWKLVLFYYIIVYEYYLIFYVFILYVILYWLNDVYVGFSYFLVIGVYCICIWVC